MVTVHPPSKLILLVMSPKQTKLTAITADIRFPPFTTAQFLLKISRLGNFGYWNTHIVALKGFLRVPNYNERFRI